MNFSCIAMPEARFHGRDTAQDIKQRGIGWNLKIEIHQAVCQDANDAENCGQGYGTVDIGRPVAHCFRCGAKDQP